MAEELIVVKQLPVIEDRLRQVKDEIERRVQIALSMVCTEETYKEVKRERAELAKEYRMLEERRKEVKKAVLAPYEAFESVYKSCAGDVYAAADKRLKEKIDEVENGIKREKADEIKAFFEEYRVSKGIDARLVPFERAGIKVTMSVSRKNLQDQAVSYLDRVADDLALIATMDSADEILVEYRKSLNASQAVTTVADRHKAIQEAQRRRAEQEAEKMARDEAQTKIEDIIAEETADAKEDAPVKPPEAIPAPIEIPSDEEVYSTSFRVVGTITQLKALKTFLTEGGYNYEQL